MPELCMSGTDRYQSTSSLSPVGRARRIKAVPGPFLLGRVNQPGIGIIHHTYCLVHTTKVGIIHHTAWFILQSWNYSSYCLVHTTKLELFIILPCFYYKVGIIHHILPRLYYKAGITVFIILPCSYYIQSWNYSSYCLVYTTKLELFIIQYAALFILQSLIIHHTAFLILQIWNYSSYTAWFIQQSWNYSLYSMLPCSYYKVGIIHSTNYLMHFYSTKLELLIYIKPSANCITKLNFTHYITNCSLYTVCSMYSRVECGNFF